MKGNYYSKVLQKKVLKNTKITSSDHGACIIVPCSDLLYCWTYWSSFLDYTSSVNPFQGTVSFSGYKKRPVAWNGLRKKEDCESDDRFLVFLTFNSNKKP